MYFADLTDFDYLPIEPTTSRMPNVGWLDSSHPFPVGDVDPPVRDRLVDLAADPQHVARGMHHCDLCDVESPVVVTRTDDPRRRAALGFAEIRVPTGGLVYVAPTLVVHYIDTHRYLPPPAFLDAVSLTTAEDRRDGGPRVGRLAPPMAVPAAQCTVGGPGPARGSPRCRRGGVRRLRLPPRSRRRSSVNMPAARGAATGEVAILAAWCDYLEWEAAALRSGPG